MQELIQRIVQNVGLDPSVAEAAVGIIMKFLATEGPQDKMAEIMAMLPGADKVIAADGGGGGGLMGALGGMMGGSMGGLMGVMGQLGQAGVGMGDIQNVTNEIVGYAKEKAGADTVNAVLGQIPGLGAFIR